MAFQDHIEQEVDALVNRLIEQSAEAARQHLDTLRQAVASAFRQAEIASSTGPDIDGTAASAEYVQRLVDSTQAYANQAREEVLSDARATIGTLQSELEQHVQHEQASARVIEGLKAEERKLRGDLATLQERHADEARMRAEADQQFAELHETLNAIRAELTGVSAKRDEAVAAQQEALATIVTLKQKVEVAEEQQRDSAALLEENGTHLASSKRVNAELTAIVHDLEAKLEVVSHHENDAQALRLDKADIYERAVAFLSVSFDRLLGILDTLGHGATTAEILDAITTTLASEFSRVVLFSVKPHGLETVRQVGFDEIDMSHVVIPLAIDSLLARATASGKVEMLTDPELSRSGETAFGGSPSVAIALPIALGGVPVAVVYADDSDQPHRELVSPALRRKFAELVGQHVMPILMRCAADQNTMADLDQYATSLLAVLQSAYEADLRAEVSTPERQDRLSQHVEYARRLFEQRARPHGTRAATLLDDHLRAAFGVRPMTPFSSDLAVIIEEVRPQRLETTSR